MYAHVLTHDFGAVQPAALQTHTFSLTNPTAAAWTFERFHTTCGCTVADISAPVVPPGGSVDVVLRYRPPAEPADDRRFVDVTFREPDAPRFRLTVAAKVRHPLTLLPVRVRLARVPYGKPYVERVTVEDYSGEALPAPKLFSNRDWLTVGTPEPLPATEPGMTCRWAVPLTVAADRMPPGDHAADVTAAPDQPHAATLRLPVEVQVVPPLDPIPSQLFFGRAVVGKPATVTFRLRVPAGVATESLTLSHDLGPQLTTARTAAGADGASFTATLTATTAGMVRGTLTVRCNDPAVPETKLTVMAMGATDAP